MRKMTELQSNVVEQELPTEQNPTVTEQTDVQTPNEELVVSAEENPSPKKKKKGMICNRCWPALKKSEKNSIP